MRTAYLDCFGGISGNMALAAVMDAGASPRSIRQAAARVVRDFRLSVKADARGGLAGVHVRVQVRGKTQPRRGLREIEKLIRGSGLPGPVRETSLKVFHTLAAAEARVHRVALQEIHFHEVGAVDAIVDVVGTVAGFHELGIETAVCSPLPLAGGEVNCAHGLLPLPAPAVMELIKGLPVRGVSGQAELVTPTGAALAVTLAASFGPLPAMKLVRVGVGLGDRELAERPNLMRLFVGESLAAGETMIQFEAALDDMAPERFDYLLDQLHQAGAVEALLIPAQMKKNRPGTLVRVLAGPGSGEAVLNALFKHSTTLGVRQYEVQRTVLPRSLATVSTAFGRIRIKRAYLPDGRERWKPEYDDLKRAAQKSGADLFEVEREIRRVLDQKTRKRP